MVIADDLEFNINDDEIVQSVLHDFNNTPSLKEIEKPEEKFFYSVFSASQTSISFVEK